MGNVFIQNMSSLPHLLLTNDDGIDSPFLHALVNSLSEIARLTVVAPAREQSWISKAISRYREIEVHSLSRPSWYQGSHDHLRLYQAGGTPADCVNLGLQHFCPSPPEAIVSGINIGFNAGLSFILSSGTVGGAVEGALQNKPALAFSMALPPEAFLGLKSDPPSLSREIHKNLDCAAARAREFIPLALEEPGDQMFVHNINFPTPTHPDTPIRETHPARLQVGGLFAEHRPGIYHFSFPGIDRSNLDPASDTATLQEGRISHSRLRFSLQ